MQPGLAAILPPICLLFSVRLNLAVIKESRFCQTRGLACLVVMVGVVIRLREVEALED